MSFHHISTLSVFGPDATGPRVVTEATPVAQSHRRGSGYAASKWAAEMLIADATVRGAHVGVHRLGRAGGSAATGATSLGDMFSRVLISSAQLGCYPEDPRLAFRVLPVDVMARAIVALALAEPPPAAVHHLHHQRQTDLSAYMAVHDRRHGTTTLAVDLADWTTRLRAAGASDPPPPAAVYLEHLRELGASPPAVGNDRYDNTATEAALSRLGVTLPELDDAYIDRCWDHLDDARTETTVPAHAEGRT